MMRRLGLGALAAATALAAAPWLPPHLSVEADSVCADPTITGVGVVQGGQLVNQQFATFGDQLTVAGTGFTSAGSPGCAVNGVTQTVSVGGVAQDVVSASDTAITFRLDKAPTGASAVDGPLVVTVTSNLSGNSGTSSQDLIVVTRPVTAALTPSTPGAAQPVTVSGDNLDLGSSQGGKLAGEVASADLDYSAPAGQCPTSAPAQVTGPATLTSAALAHYCLAGVTLRLTAFANAAHSATFTLPPIALGNVDVAPSPIALAGRHVTAGTTTVLSGSGLGFGGSATVGGQPAPVSFADTSVAVGIPDSAVNDAAVRVVRSADGLVLPISGGLSVDARVDGVSPSTAGVGDSVTISGGGFGPDPGTVSIGSATFPVQSWSPTSITVSVPPGAPSGVLGIQPKDTSPPATAPRLTVAPRITGVNPGHAGAGAAFEIVGTSFGAPQPGDAVSVGGSPATISLWSDTQVVAAIPGGVPAGSAAVQLTVPGAPGPVSASITVDPPAAGPAGAAPPPAGAPVPGQPGRSGQAAPGPPPGIVQPAPGGPLVTANPPPFQKPVPQPGSPVIVSLSATTTEIGAGQVVPLTVSVVAFGKPVVGTTVSFLLVVLPGSDGSLSVPSAVTDAQGRATVLLRLSRTAGDTIVLARAGQYQDEIRVVGRAAPGASAGASAAAAGPGSGGGVLTAPAPPQRPVVVGMLIACLILFVTGFGIQLWASATGSAAAASGLPRRSLLALAGDAHRSAVRFAGAVTAAGRGRLTTRGRRRGRP